VIGLPKSVGTVGAGNMAEAILRGLLRAGLSAERITRLTLADLVVEDADVLARVDTAPPEASERAWVRAPGLARTYSLWRKKRAALDVCALSSDTPCFTTAEGAAIPAESLPEHLRSARMVRLNGAFNTLLCTGLHAVRYGSGEFSPELTHELA
jgi:hypothetical protein